MANSYLAHPDLLREYIDDIMGIVDQQLGHDYLSEQQVRESMQPGGTLYMGVAFPDRATNTEPPVSIFFTSLPKKASGRNNGLIQFDDSIIPDPVGVCFGGVFSQPRLASYLNMDTTEYPDGLEKADLVGVIRTTAVREDMQRKGIGTELVGETVTTLEQQNVDRLLAVGWRSPTGVNIHNILNDHGLSPVAEYQDYWMEESRERSFHCPACGPPPCRCSGLLYLD